MEIFSEIEYLFEFVKELKVLSKNRFRTLRDDLDIFIDTALKLYHKLKIDYDGIKQVSDLSIGYPNVYKVTKFACKALKGKGVKSGIRIIYAYYEDLDKIEFIEIYHKSDKENENRERIKQHYKK